MPAILNPAMRLALLAGGALALAASCGQAFAHDRGYDRDGAYSFGDRHEAAKERHYDDVRRFEDGHGGHGEACDCDDDAYGDGRRDRSHRHRGHRRHGDYDDGFVCDPDGDRCYRSDSPYWDYREYYRRHGYRWLRE
jgi:hypothetical protein